MDSVDAFAIHSLQSHTSNFFQRGFAQEDLSQPVLKQGFHSARHSCGADCGSVLTFHDHVAYVGVNLEQLKDTYATVQKLDSCGLAVVVIQHSAECPS